MCAHCDRTVLQTQHLIDAIDKNRVALAEVLNQIHKDMDSRFVIVNAADGTTRPADLIDNPLGAALMANYVAAFMAAECPADEGIAASIANFYDTGIEHGHAYAAVRHANLQ